MAGAGSRFAEAGYHAPKPFIYAEGKPLIAHVLDDVRRAFDDRSRIVCLAGQEHRPYTKWFSRLDPGPYFEFIEGKTEGAACTALLAEQHFHADRPLLIANSDQTFRAAVPRLTGAAAVLTFEPPLKDASKWSYLLPDGKIVEKPEVIPESRRATIGVYWFARAGDFFDSARRMIAANDRTRGEFYLAPVLNYLPPGSRIEEVPVMSMHGLGTPEDLSAYESR